MGLAAACGGDGGEGAVPVADLGDGGPAADADAREAAHDGGAPVDPDSGAVSPTTPVATEPADAAAGPAPSAPPVIPAGTPLYEVPVSTELAPYARYPVPEVVWTVKDGTRRLEYVLPADLVGAPQQVELKGPDAAGSWTLAGESFGSATCTQTGARVVCMERLAGVPIDSAAVAERAAAGQISAEQLQVARAFASDPIGVLSFDAQ